MRKRNIIAAVIGLSASALAGAKITIPVTIVNPNTYYAYAYGSLGSTRNTADNISYLGCDVSNYPSGQSVTCSAKDAEGHLLGCTSQNATLVDGARNLTQNSYLYFTIDSENVSSCMTIRVATSSRYAVPEN